MPMGAPQCVHARGFRVIPMTPIPVQVFEMTYYVLSGMLFTYYLICLYTPTLKLLVN